MYPPGIPYKPFVPGVSFGWESSLEMCREVLRDLEVPWVQDFMLRSRPRQDTNALVDPANFSRSASSVVHLAALPEISGGFSGTLELERLMLPVGSIEHLGVGMGVERTTASESVDAIFPLRITFFRCVTNTRDQSFLYIADHELLRTVAAQYFKYGKDGLWIAALLIFERCTFFEAVNTKNKKIDFEKLNHHLIHSFVGAVKHTHSPTMMTVNHLYPDIYMEVFGDHPMTTVFTSHANGQAMMTFPVHNFGRWSFHRNDTALRKMLNWGITDRMRKVRFSPGIDGIMAVGNSILNEQAGQRNNTINERRLHHPCLNPEITAIIADEDNNNEISEAPPPHPGATFINRSFTSSTRNINIAPRPTIPAGDQNGSNSAKPDPYEPTKTELRKIRNREAAARSYQRKLAAETRWKNLKEMG